MLAFIAGMVSFALHLPPLQIALIVAAIQLMGKLINAFGLYIVPGLVGLGTLFSYISGYGIYLIIVIITGFVLGGWQAVVAFFVEKIIASLVGQVLEYWQTSRYHKLTGHHFTWELIKLLENKYHSSHLIHRALIF